MPWRLAARELNAIVMVMLLYPFYTNKIIRDIARLGLGVKGCQKNNQGVTCTLHQHVMWVCL